MMKKNYFVLVFFMFYNCMFSLSSDLNGDNSQPISVFDKIENINKDTQKKLEKNKIIVIEKKNNKTFALPIASSIVIPTKDTEISEILFKLSDLESILNTVKSKNQEYENILKAYILNTDGKKGSSSIILIIAIIMNIVLIAMFGYLLSIYMVLRRKINNIQIELGSTDTPVELENERNIEMPLEPVISANKEDEPLKSYLFNYINKDNTGGFIKQVEKWEHQSLYGVISKNEFYTRIAIVLANISNNSLDEVWDGIGYKKDILLYLAEDKEISLSKIYDLNKTLMEDMNTEVDSRTLLKKIWLGFSTKVKEEFYADLSDEDKQRFNLSI